MSSIGFAFSSLAVNASFVGVRGRFCVEVLLE